MGESAQVLFNLLLFSLAFFIIVKHFLHSSKESGHKESNLDDLIREKKRTFEETLVRENPLQKSKAIEDKSFFEELRQKLQWGDAGNLCQRIISKEYEVMIAPENVSARFINGYLNQDRISKKDFSKKLILEILKNSFKQKKMPFELGKMDYPEAILSLSILIDEKEKVFKCFDGQKESLLKIHLSKEVSSLFVEKVSSALDKSFFIRWRKVSEESDRFFLLPIIQLESDFEEVEDKKKLFKELSLHYHPDRIPWKYVPQEEKERLSKIYTTYFSKLQDLSQRV